MTQLIHFPPTRFMPSAHSKFKFKRSSNRSPRSRYNDKLVEAVNVFQRLALTNPWGLAMLVSLGRKMLQLSGD